MNEDLFVVWYPDQKREFGQMIHAPLARHAACEFVRRKNETECNDPRHGDTEIVMVAPLKSDSPGCQMVVEARVATEYSATLDDEE
jgi:hypothetical protein